MTSKTQRQKQKTQKQKEHAATMVLHRRRVSGQCMDCGERWEARYPTSLRCSRCYNRNLKRRFRAAHKRTDK